MSVKVGLISLGCDKNLVDSEFMLGILKKHNYVITNKEKDADVIIVNTCGFIESAKQESIDTILEMAQYKNTGNCKLLIATGCLAQRYKETLLEEIPELDAVVGTGEFYRIHEVIQRLNGSKVNLTENSNFVNFDIKNRVRIYPYISFVKIAEGCSNHCSYCAIPFIRGPYRSREIAAIKEEVEMLVSDGVKEINLVAQDTTNYGVDIYGKPALSRLLEELIKIEGEFWIRILYAYPTNIDDGLLDLIESGPKIAKYLDIPLQHINDRILKLMNRPTDSRFIKRLIERIKNKIPDIALRTTFIVGFPSETEREFEELLDFVKQYQFDRVGAFKYSEEEGTRAANIEPKIRERIKNHRYRKLMQLQRTISGTKNAGLRGKVIRVLAERLDRKTNLFIGRSERDAPFVDGVVSFYGPNCRPGNVYPVKILQTYDYDLVGEAVEER
ncbi:30S ribosomal protein S12 methylthiotransferase RimO [Thermoanaerobacterium sp. DL9XJH110]|uniref:30S ribosomal protein S12 methylthiotransferase RimO n=1 Tax=Thermoanaerobacterium sp. DL9XJH110 TaxID=3386643 RepID=UPI003BB5D48B